jgi:hypothetical protein
MHGGLSRRDLFAATGGPALGLGLGALGASGTPRANSAKARSATSASSVG